MRIAIFLLSVAMAILMLFIERSFGITWDFHPDSVTYAMTSIDVFNVILNNDWLLALNNGYYMWVALLNESIWLVTTGNIIMFSITNVMIYSIHARYGHTMHVSGGASAFVLMLLLANPYRLHLATTMLKDSMIILMTVYIGTRPWRKAGVMIPALILVRIAGAIYLALKLSRRQLLSLLLVSVILASIFSSILSQTLLEFNGADMRLRDFDQIPNFIDLGLAGPLLRSMTWPFLAITGGFAVLSPAAAFIPVAVASVMSLAYCFITTRRLLPPLAVIVPMAVFAAIVTGYTAYIRYIYPLMVVLPLIVISQHSFLEGIAGVSAVRRRLAVAG